MMHELDIYFINLAKSVERREAFLKNFAACNFLPHWQAHRFVAIEADHPLVQAAGGELRAGGKGCWMSTLEILRHSMDKDRDILIVDDDISFCPQSQAIIDMALDSNLNGEWDMIYTDTIVPNAIDMPRFLYERRTYEQAGELKFLEMPCSPFNTTGGSAIINKNSRQKIIDLMTMDRYDTPIDLYFTQAIKDRRIVARLIFPFVTAPSMLADASNLKVIDDKDYVGRARIEHAMHNDFRRMLWIGRNDEEFFADRPFEAYGSMSDMVRKDVQRLTDMMKPLLSIMMTYPP